MNTYEYKTIKIEGKGFFNTSYENDKLLDEYGAEGWKVVASFPEMLNGSTVSIYYTLMKEHT